MEPAHSVTSSSKFAINDVAVGSAELQFGEDLEQMTGEAVGLDLRPTSFILQAAGAIIDVLASLALLAVIAFALFSPLVSGLFDTSTKTALSISAAVFCLIVAPAAVETLTHGKSLGRLAVGARIVRNDGGAIGFRHAFIRALTGSLEIYSTFGGIAGLVGLLNSRSQRLGDLLAGTYSQNERISRVAAPVYGIPNELLAWSATADVARMPDGLSRRISQFLAQSTRLSPDARNRLSAELAAEASRYVSPLPRANAELFLAAVRVLRRQRELRALELRAEQLKRLEPVLTALPHGFVER
jgi:uncharacterized RDD family membrane protein YckC